MTNPDRIAELREYRDKVAEAWHQVIVGDNPRILAKLAAYLYDGSYEAEMPTALIQAQAALLEALLPEAGGNKT